MSPLFRRILRGRWARRTRGTQKAIQNAGWLFVDRVVRMAVGLVIGVWLARYLGPDQFGLFSYSTSLLGLVSVLATLGLQNVVVRKLVLEESAAANTLGTAVLLQFAGGVVGYFVLLALIAYLRPDDLIAQALVGVLGISLVFRVSQFIVWWFEAKVRSKYVIWVQITCFLLFAAIKVLLIMAQAPLIFFAWSAVGEALLASLALLALMNQLGLPVRLLRASWSHAKSLIRDSWPLMLSALSVSIYTQIDQVMLGQMVGDRSVGVYRAAVNLSTVWYFIPTIVVASVFPAFLRSRDESAKKYHANLQSLFDLMSSMSIPLAAGTTVLSPTLVELLYGDNYGEAASVLSVHIWACVFVFIGVPSARWFLAEGLQRVFLLRTLANGVVNVILNLILIPRYGATGAAAALVVSQSAGFLIYDHLREDTRGLFIMKVASFNPIGVGRRFFGALREA